MKNNVHDDKRGCAPLNKRKSLEAVRKRKMHQRVPRTSNLSSHSNKSSSAAE